MRSRKRPKITDENNENDAMEESLRSDHDGGGVFSLTQLGSNTKMSKKAAIVRSREGRSESDAAMSLSFSLAVIVILAIFILIVPTLLWVHLKLPKLKRPMELICLIPLAIPAIVLVVGISPLYRFISIHITESPLALAGIYSMLVLPYVYRSLSSALDIADINTLYEAARTLGSGTMRLMIQVIMPTVRSGIMNGAVIAIALVLGEFTIASLLNFENLQVTLFQVGRSDGNVAVAVSVASLLLVLILLILIPTTQRKKSVLDVDVA